MADPLSALAAVGAVLTHKSSPKTLPLVQRAKKMNQQAGELLELLEGLKVTETSKGIRRVFESTKQAAKALSNRSKIEKKQNELQNATGQLAIALLQHIAEMQATLITDTDRHKWNDIQMTLQNLSGIAAKEFTEGKQKWRHVQNTLDELARSNKERVELERTKARQRLDKLRVEPVVRSLSFEEIDSRHGTVATAYENTYTWAIRKRDSKLRTWLANGSGLFWVCGKPGSGKSTFMKFLLHNQEASSLLNAWTSSGHRSMVAEFFFWYLGTPMQKSIRGLLQGILYKILRNCPELVLAACPERLESEEACQRSWSEQELFQAAHASARTDCQSRPLDKKLTTPDLRLALFIDGLDEFDGNHVELVSVLQGLAAGDRIKVCISCRPWNIFLNAIGQSPLVINLEDLTTGDIEHYVRDKLAKAELSQRSRSNLFGRRAPQAERLVQAVVGKANGVFFWVFLVVPSLINGYEEGDNIDIMQKRVDLLPGELIPYFTLMLERMDTIYQRISATALAIASIPHRKNPQGVHAISFADLWPMVDNQDHFEDPAFALRQRMAPYSIHELQQMRGDTARMIRSSCRDFLHIPKKSRFPYLEEIRVEFIHRTVHDFLTLKDAHGLLSDLRPRYFDDASFPLQVALARATFVPIGRLGDPCKHVDEMARWICVSRLRIPSILRELDNIQERYIDEYCPSSCPIHEGIPTSTSLGRCRIMCDMGLHRTSVRTFAKRLEALKATKADKQMAKTQERQSPSRKSHIIRFAFGQGVSVTKGDTAAAIIGFERLDFGLISSLLSRGADPDEIIVAFGSCREEGRYPAPLAMFIRNWLFVPTDASQDANIWSIIRLLIENGAKVPQSCLEPGVEYRRSVADKDFERHRELAADNIAWRHSNMELKSIHLALRFAVPETRLSEIGDVLEELDLY